MGAQAQSDQFEYRRRPASPFDASGARRLARAYDGRGPPGVIVPICLARRYARPRSSIPLPTTRRSRSKRGDHPAAYVWGDADWRGRPWEECVVYELHVGAFTPQGTFRAAIARLDFLRDLGVTALELMPVADFPGQWNWGYDGVLLFAPDSSYGRPEDLKAFIDAAHQRNIAVLLDVVYNHFGPEGHYLPKYSPIFTEKHKNPWGAAVNFDGEGSKTVRDMIVDNAIYWVNEFNLDGLRLDAVHAIIDDSEEHILDVIARRIRESSSGRRVHLILENEANQASRLFRTVDGEPRQFTAQWNDDVHHVLHTAAIGETSGYYADYAGDTGKLGGHWPRVLPFRARSCTTAARRGASPVPPYRQRPLSPSSKTMTRLAIVPLVTGWAALQRRHPCGRRDHEGGRDNDLDDSADRRRATQGAE